jgi:chromosome segregation ATPase
VLLRIRETNSELSGRTDEFNQLRSDLSIVEGKNFGERREIERLDNDIRDA